MKTIFSDNNLYQTWRDNKLKHAIVSPNFVCVEISNPLVISLAEKAKIISQMSVNNFVIYQFNIEKCDISHAVLAINKQLGLVDYDKHLYANTEGLAEISPSNNKHQDEFIPYTNKQLNWHTDGYYNNQRQRIRSFSLFCLKPAKSGGENEWIDHEIVYILLREKSSTLANILIQNDIMTVPEHKIDAITRREASIGAVFLIDKLTGALVMRYTQRKQNIIWKNSSKVQQARFALSEILENKTPYHFKYKMQAGQGIICHNIPHRRSAFAKHQERLMLRGRYFNRVK